jgi:hypothetical protein
MKKVGGSIRSAVRFAGLAVLAVALLAGSQAQVREPFRWLLPWKAMFEGVELAVLDADQPRRMRGYAVRIDLHDPGISFLATPDNGDRPGHTDGLKTSTFLSRYGCQVAINAAPFSPVVNEEGQGHEISGLTVSRGRLVSPHKQNFPALVIRQGNRVEIGRGPFELADVANAVAGFHIVLEQGKVVAGGRDIHPRTAAGVSADGRWLVLLVIDGRQPGYSLGATTAEVGEWLLALGAWNGINLDGGGTSTLVLEGSDGRAEVVNRPIHAGIPGLERVSASHLGVFARRLQQP